MKNLLKFAAIALLVTGTLACTDKGTETPATETAVTATETSTTDVMVTDTSATITETSATVTDTTATDSVAPTGTDAPVQQ
jgi:hypothetical protein